MKKAYKIFMEKREFIDNMDSVDPESIERLFKLTKDLEQEQLMALASIVKTDYWMDSPLVFENLVLLLNGISPSVAEFEGCSIPHIWYALFLMGKFRPDLQLGELVKGYIDFTHSEGGFYIYPQEAGMKSPISAHLTEILSRVGKEEFDDFDFDDHQASILSESIEYIKIKSKEDEINGN